MKYVTLIILDLYMNKNLVYIDLFIIDICHIRPKSRFIDIHLLYEKDSLPKKL